MKITWKDSARSWNFTIKVEKFYLKGRLVKVNKNSPYSIICEDLHLKKEVLNETDFISIGIINEKDKINLAKEKTIEIIKKTLKERQETYNSILTKDMKDVLTWKEPIYSKDSEIYFHDFYFINGRKKVHGSVSFINGDKTSYLELFWMNKRMILDSSDEKEFKNQVFEIMKQESSEKLKILNELELTI